MTIGLVLGTADSIQSSRKTKKIFAFLASLYYSFALLMENLTIVPQTQKPIPSPHHSDPEIREEWEKNPKPPDLLRHKDTHGIWMLSTDTETIGSALSLIVLQCFSICYNLYRGEDFYMIVGEIGIEEIAVDCGRFES